MLCYAITERAFFAIDTYLQRNAGTMGALCITTGIHETSDRDEEQWPDEMEDGTHYVAFGGLAQDKILKLQDAIAVFDRERRNGSSFAYAMDRYRENVPACPDDEIKHLEIIAALAGICG